MSRVRGKDTVPELIIRRMLHRMGYRFRLHRKDLAGNPDIVLPRLRSVIFVHGCFWHGHEGCRRSKRPSTNVEFWTNKIDTTIARDENSIRLLKDHGWRVLVIWGCEVRNIDYIKTTLIKFLG